mmetsp:Transcript_69097/g.162565  ORF Transcript_69097/g.162565 Transcript_69097/m.162565 type:complete len:239 (+) Transcript_69097:1-717(+)
MAAMQRHTITAMRAIFRIIAGKPASEQQKQLSRLVEAYQSCQAVQSRVIDAIYGGLTGRDRSLQDQVLLLLDEQKQRVLDEVTHELNPHAMAEGDGSPQQQFPHIQSAYRLHCGPRLGLRGIAAARVDRCQPPMDKTLTIRVLQTFRRRFMVHELADEIVADINQPKTTPGERRLGRDQLVRWATESEGFDKHSIFYDEDHKELYNDAKPVSGEEYEPFLCRKVAIDILRAMFVTPSS